MQPQNFELYIKIEYNIYLYSRKYHSTGFLLLSVMCGSGVKIVIIVPFGAKSISLFEFKTAKSPFSIIYILRRPSLKMMGS